MAPYPKEWERHLKLDEGTAVFVRPLRPDDERLYGAFLKAVTPDDLRLRLFGPVTSFSHEFLARFTVFDYARAMAFIALKEATGEMLGVARLHDGADGRSGEFAIIVRSDLKGHGLGWKLMTLLIEYAQAKGLRMIEGQVLRENATMLKMCREFGFAVERDTQDASVCRVSRAV